MKIELPKSFAKDLSGVVGKYNFQVGILEDKQHFWPKGVRGVKSGKAGPGGNLKTYAGGPARLTSSVADGKTASQVLIDNMKRLSKNILLAPFKKKNSPLLKFMEAFLKMAVANAQPRRVENLLQAVVRNPILKGAYGENTLATARSKGFNRLLISTGQMFKAIEAKVIRVRK